MLQVVDGWPRRPGSSMVDQVLKVVLVTAKSGAEGVVLQYRPREVAYRHDTSIFTNTSLSSSDATMLWASHRVRYSFDKAASGNGIPDTRNSSPEYADDAAHA